MPLMCRGRRSRRVIGAERCHGGSVVLTGRTCLDAISPFGLGFDRRASKVAGVEAEIGHHQVVDVEDAWHLAGIVRVDLQPGARDRIVSMTIGDWVELNPRGRHPFVPLPLPLPLRLPLPLPAWAWVPGREPVGASSGRVLVGRGPVAFPGARVGGRALQAARGYAYLEALQIDRLEVQPLEDQPLDRRARREGFDADQRRDVAPPLVADDEAGAAHPRLREDRHLQRRDLGFAVEAFVQRLDREVPDVRRRPCEERGERRHQHRADDGHGQPAAAVMRLQDELGDLLHCLSQCGFRASDPGRPNAIRPSPSVAQ